MNRRHERGADRLGGGSHRLGFGARVILTILALASSGCEKTNPEPVSPVGTTTGSKSTEVRGGLASRTEVEPTFDPVADLPDAPSAEEWTDEHTRRVEGTCSSCHVLPPPSALTRERWELVIPSMAAMPGPDGVPEPTDEELAWALAYYTRRAPESLGPVASYPPSSPLEFTVEHFTPPGLEREKIPAVAHVKFVHLERPDRAEILLSEMRTQVLMLHIPWAPEPVRSKIRPLVPKLDYPVHTELFDFDRDGLDDLITAGIGGMNPGDEVRGRVSISFQNANRKFTRHSIQSDLARPCDARPADLDGDGDFDLLVSAFGWRGPGELLWLENSEPGRMPPRFIPHPIDVRDGFIHLEPEDFDGDGDCDFAALLSQEHEQIVLYLNDGQGSFTSRVLFQAPHSAWGFAGMEKTDLDGDGDSDLLIVNGDTLDDDLLKPYHGVRWLENLGDLRFALRDIVTLAGCEAATAVDLDSDGDIDVVGVAFLPQIPPEVWREHGLDSVIWAENLGRGPNGFDWQVHSLEKERCIHPTVAAADYNGDGRIDIAVGNYVWLPTDGTPLVRSDYLTLFTGR